MLMVVYIDTCSWCVCTIEQCVHVCIFFRPVKREYYNGVNGGVPTSLTLASYQLSTLNVSVDTCRTDRRPNWEENENNNTTLRSGDYQLYLRMAILDLH